MLKVLVVLPSLSVAFREKIIALKNLLEEKNLSFYYIQLFEKAKEYKSIPMDKLDFRLLNNILFKKINDINISKRYIKNKLLKKIDEIDPDIILGGQIGLLSGAVSLCWAKKNKKAFVGFDDAKYNIFKRNILVTFFKKILMKQIDAFIYPTEDWLQTGLYWGLNENSLFWGYNVVNNTFWNKKVINDFENIPSEYFINITRHVFKKNLVNLLKAYSIYRENGGKIDLILVGSGPEDKKLKSLASATKGIYFMDFLSCYDVRKLYQNARFMFLPSFREETWGLTTNESMAAGVPACISQECGASVLIEDAQNGYKYNPHNVIQIAETFEKAEHIDENKYAIMCEKAKQTISKYDLNYFAINAYNAAMFAFNNKKESNYIANMAMNFWQGKI
jgi:glycosyltransferase involved in cell wall biosynthesis